MIFTFVFLVAVAVTRVAKDPQTEVEDFEAGHTAVAPVFVPIVQAPVTAGIPPELK